MKLKINIFISKSQISKIPAVFFILFAFASAQPNRENGIPILTKLEHKEVPTLKDDGDISSLKLALEHSLSYYDQRPDDTLFLLGEDRYTSKDLKESHLALKKYLKRKRSPKALSKWIQENYILYRSSGVTFSSYYEYGLTASLKRTEEFRYPLYSRPQELVDVRLDLFDLNKRGERVVGRVVGKELLPYYTREEIDTKKVLTGRSLEIAWANNPLEILFLQIQGSGWFSTPEGGTYRIRYTGDNGHPYRSIGLYLIQRGILSKENFSRQKMIDTLNGMSEEERQRVLNQNPRYIFFEVVSDTVPIRGSLSVPLTGGRSIATDPKFYPPGALAWISSQKPTFDKEGNKIRTEPLTRFVFNQDEGGAIKGINRVDYFAGRGIDAKRFAENLWHPGEIYFLIKKK